MKIYIFLDTNILDKQFLINPEIEELLRFTNLSGNDVEIVLTEIVLQELVDHARNEIVEKNESIKSINKLKLWADKIPIREFEVEELILKYKEQLLTNYPFTFFAPDINVFKKVYDRYFQRLKPFDNKKQQFKDGLLWETILNFKEKVNIETSQYFLISKNSNDFAINKQNINVLHPDYKAEFSGIELKNDINSFLVDKGYYDDYEIDSLKEEKMLERLKEYFSKHNWEFEEPLNEYIFEKNVSSKNEFALSGIKEQVCRINNSKKPRKSSLYIHVPLIIKTSINLLVREHSESWVHGGDDDEYILNIIPAEITCEAVFSEAQDDYSVVIMDKIRIYEKPDAS
ncbi:PIN domain-containing protein [Sporosarcina sp. YIM B06819]|uniref:PIN domain-containing protein n=1 Tax=Sporosarcina sp. YIM B06819 TaxID=3081769 RepID=UPI00298D1533|nr:PIN domain-containing protein [Sporosarcina sp. YIM B06819]